MAKNDTFKVSKRGMEGVEIEYPFPESLDDPRWDEIVNENPADINELAVSAFRVRLQGAIRPLLEEGAEAVQAGAGEYVYGRRTPSKRRSRARVSKDAIEEGGFSEEQLALLRNAGVAIED